MTNKRDVDADIELTIEQIRKAMIDGRIKNVEWSKFDDMDVEIRNFKIQWEGEA